MCVGRGVVNRSMMYQNDCGVCEQRLKRIPAVLI